MPPYDVGVADPLVHDAEDASSDGSTRCGLYYPTSLQESRGDPRQRWRGVLVEEPTTCLWCLGAP